MEKIDRRSFLRSTALMGGSLFGIEGLIARGALGAAPPAYKKGLGDYGPLVLTPPVNTDDPLLAGTGNSELRGKALLGVPAGFLYTVIGRQGTVMSDGAPTPGAHDGMAAFAGVNGSGQSRIRLVRNHEQTGVAASTAAFGSLPYDAHANGGTTTLVVNPQTRLLEDSFASLSGTVRNCAGGPTPWGSWISCEEIVVGPAPNNALTHLHGYCFEVPADGIDDALPVALPAMGRFSHEAMAVDPATRIIYETEDAGATSGFYRFLPDDRGDATRAPNLTAGGRFQMLAVKYRPQYDTRTGQQPGRRLLCVWIDIPDPNPAVITGSTSVFAQGLARGGARFNRLEGCWYGNGCIYFDSTQGGNVGEGQIWEYRPLDDAEGYLTLIYESPNGSVLDNPDNLCVTPRGGLVLCEDGDLTPDFVHGLTPQGRIFPLIRNNVPGQTDSEFAGSTFSPDGETLFVNIQGPGLTVALWPDAAQGRRWTDGAL